MNAKQTWETVKGYVTELIEEFEQDNVSSLAAALAYFATFSIVPMVVIGIALGGIVFGEETTRTRVLAELGTWFGPAGVEFVSNALGKSGVAEKSSNIWATVVSVAILVVAGTRFFAELQAALNRVWEVRTTRGAFYALIRKRALSFGLIILTGALMLASTVVSMALSAVGRFAQTVIPVKIGLLELINTSVTFAVATVLFGLLFRYFPDVRVYWKDVWLGAAITSALLMLTKWALGLYVGRSAFTSQYGAAGTLLGFLFWVYVSATIVLMGAEFTQVHARRAGREIEPTRKAERR